MKRQACLKRSFEQKKLGARPNCKQVGHLWLVFIETYNMSMRGVFVVLVDKEGTHTHYT